MAEFIGQTKPAKTEGFAPGSGFDAFGKSVSFERRAEALKHCREMGLNDTEEAMACIGGMAEQIERDEPYKAIEIGMKWLDLTGTYRLLAVLCTA